MKYLVTTFNELMQEHEMQAAIATGNFAIVRIDDNYRLSRIVESQSEHPDDDYWVNTIAVEIINGGRERRLVVGRENFVIIPDFNCLFEEDEIEFMRSLIPRRNMFVGPQDQHFELLAAMAAYLEGGAVQNTFTLEELEEIYHKVKNIPVEDMIALLQ